MELDDFYCPKCGEKIRFSDYEPLVTTIEEELRSIITELEEVAGSAYDVLEERISTLERRMQIMQEGRYVSSLDRGSGLEE